MRWLVLVALVGCGSASKPVAEAAPPPVVSNEAPPAPASPVARSPSIEAGAKIFVEQGCIACHSIDGTPKIGSTMADLWGETVTLLDGTTHVVDAAYIRSALVEPSRYVRPGFPTGAMPSYVGQLTDEDMDALAAYIQSLDDASSPTEYIRSIP